MKINKNTKIEWKKVTWYSITVAVILYVSVFYLGFCFGEKIKELKMTMEQIPSHTFIQKSKNNIITAASFNCKNNKTIDAVFFDDKVELILSTGENVLLFQAISASGARYTNTSESIVFWNKGDTSFIQEGSRNTFEDCVIAKTE